MRINFTATQNYLFPQKELIACDISQKIFYCVCGDVLFPHVSNAISNLGCDIERWAGQDKWIEAHLQPAICTSIIVAATTRAHFYLCAPAALMKSPTICSCRLPWECPAALLASAAGDFHSLASLCSGLIRGRWIIEGGSLRPAYLITKLVNGGIHCVPSRWSRADYRDAAKTHLLRCTHAADQSAACRGSF